ncbi:MAG: hypothetical protein H6610_10415 [Ignavibacteriales bacterium]|nr:hypothetical protein [Ignavibacteriales bacterium]MCB9219856.1 hypothetical protein [Ignavibacteriales bacterium]
MNIKYLGLLIIFLIFVISCSDDDSPSSPESQTAKELSMKVIDIPNAIKQSSNPYAQQVNVFTTLANSFSVYSFYFTPPSGNQQFLKVNEDWTKSWTVNNITINMNYFENTTDFGWSIYLSGTDGEQTFNNTLFLEAQETIGTQQGTFKIYDPNSNTVASEWTYFTTTSDVYNLSLFSYNGDNSNKLEIISNNDNSGEFTYYEMASGDFTIDKRVAWNADGTGQWWEYDSTGTLIDSGSF